MRQTLRKKGISLFSPPLVRFSSTRVLPLLCFYILTHARRKRKRKRRSSVRIEEVRQNTKSGSFFAFGGARSRARIQTQCGKKKSTTEINGKKSRKLQLKGGSAFLSFFFSILNPKLEKTSFFVLNPNTLKNLFFFVKGKSTTP